MKKMNDQDPVSRRDVLATGLGTVAAMFLNRFGFAQTPAAKKPALKLGIQTFSLRNYGWRDALRKAKELGLTYCESYPGMPEFSLEAPKLTQYLADLKEFGFTMPTYGVIGFGKVEEHNRLWFDWGKKLGVKTLTADPEPESLAGLEKMAEEFNMFVAIHNHGPNSRYDKIESVQKAIQGRSERIGACVDTGHYLRSGEDPVAAIKAFGKRVYGVHLKDFTSPSDEAITGTGDLDIEAVFKALIQNGYQGIVSLEYEMEKDLMESLQLCVKNMKAAAKKVVG